MGARASQIEDLSASEWASKKPKCYKGSELDKALKSWESLKPVKFPEGMLPEAPAFKLREIEGCVGMLEGAVKDVEKLKKEVEDQVKVLNGITSAGKKVAGELRKMSKDKKIKEEEQNECYQAANEAESLGSVAQFFCERDFE